MGNKPSNHKIKKGYTATLHACGNMGDNQTLAPEATPLAVKFLEIIGEGGFSTVYRAKESKASRKRRATNDTTHDTANTHYAVKRMICNEDEWIVRCEEEIKMHRLCVHPNVLPLLGCSNNRLPRGATEYLLLLPYCSKGTLQDLIDRNTIPRTTACPEQDTKALFRGICQGVNAIHAQHFSHRDIKPANILFSTHTNAPMVMDLGSCAKTPLRITSSGQADLLYDVASIHSTPSYRAPELFMLSQYPTEVDTKTDVWSLGCLLYTMLFGRSPFEFGPNGSFERLAVMNGNVKWSGHGGLEHTTWQTMGTPVPQKKKKKWKKTKRKPASTEERGARVMDATDVLETIRGMLCPAVEQRWTMEKVMERTKLWGMRQKDGEEGKEGQEGQGNRRERGKEEEEDSSAKDSSAIARDSWALANDEEEPEEQGPTANGFEVNWETAAVAATPLPGSPSKKKKHKKHKKKQKKTKPKKSVVGEEEEEDEEDFGEFIEAPTKQQTNSTTDSRPVS